MAYVITDLCKRAADCVDVCPTDSIHAVEGDAKWPTYYINPDTCISCGACVVECPHDAIVDEDDGEDFVDVNANFFTAGPGKDII